ncbi:MAG TPA: four helix bundle protein [Pyrinomonadaceae bacterium]|nr:four helix bundle protein [Pyrinomonadaceae bacterium]
MQNFRKLVVWQKAHELALLTYRLTTDFPRDEAFGLRRSLRKASVDIPGYIAEGSGKASDAEFSRDLGAAFASANRLEYYALLSFDLAMLAEPQHTHYAEKIVEVKKMLSGFCNRLGNE